MSTESDEEQGLGQASSPSNETPGNAQLPLARPESAEDLAQREADEAWFLRICRANQNLIWRNLKRLLNDRDLRRDITQEALWAAWEQRDVVKTKRSVRGWLITVANNKAIDLLRKLGRKTKEEIARRKELKARGPQAPKPEGTSTEPPPDQEAETGKKKKKKRAWPKPAHAKLGLEDPSQDEARPFGMGRRFPNPLQALIEKERNDKLYAALDRLDELQRVCFTRVVLDQKSHADIGRELGLSERQVAYQYALARRRLRTWLSDLGPRN